MRRGLFEDSQDVMEKAQAEDWRSVEGALKSLDFDGTGANLKCVIDCAPLDAAAYERVLGRLERELRASPQSARLWALRGKIFSNLGRYGQARAALSRALRLDGRHPMARCWLAAVYLMEGCFSRALEELGVALRLKAGCPWAHFYRAAAYYALGMHRKAAQDLRRLSAGHGEQAAVLAAKAFWALFQAQRGRPARALRSARELISRRPKEAWPYALRATLYAEYGKIPQAAADLEAAIKRGGDRLRLHSSRARLLAAIGEVAAAEKDFKEALRASRGADQVRTLCFEMARRFEEAGMSGRACRFLRSAAGKYPDDVEVLLGLGQHLENSGRLPQAEAVFRRVEAVLRKALEDDPGSAQLWLAQTQLKTRSRDFSAAEAAARRLLSVAARPAHPVFRQARLTYAGVLMAQGDYLRAGYFLRKEIARQPQWAEAVILCSKVLLKMGRADQSLALLEKIEVTREVVKVRLEAGQALLGQGDYRRAEAAIRPVQKIFSGDYEALLFLGRLRLRQRRLARARQDFEAAWALRPDQWQIAFPLAEILLRGGRLAEMRRVLNRARRLSSAQQDVPSLVGRLRLALCLGRCAEAAGLGESILDRTRRFEDLNPLYRPALIDLDDFKGYRISVAYKRAIKRAFEKHIALRPKSPWGYYYYRQFGDKFAGGDREWEAHAWCLEKLRTFPLRRYGWMRYHMGLDLLYEHDFPAAVEQLKLAMRYSKGEDWRSQCLIGEAFLCQGDLPAALAAFSAAWRRALPQYRGYVMAWRGEVLLWAGRYKEALKVLHDVMEGGSPVPLAACWKGGALLKLGRYREALGVLETAVATPSDQEARVWLSEALYRLGRWRQALREADSVKRISVVPNFYGRVVAGLARGALGDAAGMRREYGRVPREVLAYVRQKKALGAGNSAACVRQTLEAVLELSRGVRRGNYETAVWMR